MGVTIWALTLRSDLDDTQQQLDKTTHGEHEAAARHDGAAARDGTIEAFGGLFEGDSVSAQAETVRKDLQGIPADCKDALAGA